MTGTLTPGSGENRRPGMCGECPRDCHNKPAGEELDTDPAKRTAVNVGTRPMLPRLPWEAGKVQRQLMASGGGIALVVVVGVTTDHGGRESRPQGEGEPWASPKVAQERVLGIQRKLHRWTTDDQDRRFKDLHNLVCDPATLMMAWLKVRANRGSRSTGVDGQTAHYIEQVLGVQKFLEGLREELQSGSFRPLPVKERLIPKRDGTKKLR